jgi:hypothetical protein
MIEGTRTTIGIAPHGSRRDFPWATHVHEQITKIKWSPKWSPTSSNGKGDEGSGWNGESEFANQIKLGGMR